MHYHLDESDPGLVILRADATINDASAEETVANLEQLIDEGVNRLIIDLSAVDYVNSLALSVLMRLRNRLRPRDGQLRICCTSDQIDKVIEITSLAAHLPRSATVEEARAALQG
ncbi:MAG: STAS domain-containing protein [Planctomycetota bacterium]|jgi:anti-anti-sigma factor